MREFNPARSKLRFAWEPAPGRRPPAARFDRYFRWQTEGLSLEREQIELTSITGNRQQPEGLPSKIPTNGAIAAEVEAEAHLPLLLAAQGAYSTTELEPGVHETILAPSEAIRAPTFGIEAFRDDDRTQVFSGGRVSSLSLQIAARSVLTATWNTLFQHAGYWGDAEAQTDPNPTPTLPIVRGLQTAAGWQAADGDLYLQISDLAGAPDQVAVLAKVGAASSWGLFESLVRVGLDGRGLPHWSRLYDSTSGAPLGAVDLELAVDADLTGLEVGDIFRVQRSRPEWAPILPNTLPFNEIHAAVVLDDGRQARLTQWQLTITPPVAATWSIGGSWADDVRERGLRTAVVNLQREYVETSLRDRLEAGERFGLRVECRTRQPFVGAHVHELFIVTPNLKATGRTPSVQNANQMTEQIQATAHPDASQPYPDAVTMIVKSSIGDPLA